VLKNKKDTLITVLKELESPKRDSGKKPSLKNKNSKKENGLPRKRPFFCAFVCP
jgi:hypothetical protein